MTKMYHNNGNSLDNLRNHYRTDAIEIEENHRVPSVRTVSEYATAYEHSTVMQMKPIAPSRSNRPKFENVSEKKLYVNRNGQGSDLSRDSSRGLHSSSKVLSHESPYNGSDLYVTGPPHRALSELSRGSRNSPAPSSRVAERAPSNHSGSARSGHSTVKTHTSRYDGITVKNTSTCNPFRSYMDRICCFMLLLNLGLILVILGALIVAQLTQPFFVWILGIVFLIFGCLTLLISLVYCVHTYRNAKYRYDTNLEDL